MSSPDLTLFRPIDGATKSISATTSTDNVSMALDSGDFTGARRTFRVFVETGGSTAFVAFGTTGVTASATADIPCPAGLAAGFVVDPSVTHVAAITASGTATVYITPGEGM